jgi:hypothetical protein
MTLQTAFSILRGIYVKNHINSAKSASRSAQIKKIRHLERLQNTCPVSALQTEKSQISKNKFQTNPKNQLPKVKIQFCGAFCFEHLYLLFWICLLIVVCSL